MLGQAAQDMSDQALGDAAHRLERLLASATDAVITIDEASRIVDWNGAAERIFGWRRAEAMGQILTDLIVPKVHTQSHHRGVVHYLKTREGPIFKAPIETRAIRRSGEEFDIELSVWPVQTSKGWTFSSFIRDISSRKAAERALAQSEANYRTLIENAVEGILITAGGRILYANPQALQFTGVSAEQAAALPFTEFIHPDDRERVLGNHLKRLRGEPVENQYEFRVVHQGHGEVLWLNISAVGFSWQGAPATLNFLTDITRRKHAEEEVHKALERERELSELKSRFVALASHEFRTPLAAILSSAELLDDYADRLAREERSEMIGMIKSAVARMSGMVEQVMLSSQIAAGGFSFRPEPTAMRPWLDGVLAELGRASQAAERVQLSCDNMAQPRLLDGELARHVLLNLLGNALKYSPGDAAVYCQLREAGQHLRLEIRDQGIGIPAADIPRLFDSFSRGNNVGNIKGTGVGLYIVQECVRLHGGEVEVESVQGRGSVFRVSLLAPLAKQHPGSGRDA
jgi:PAS domain S-box-containing protein